jgi:N-dimethylarginine dimethylaminohydrolase
MITLKVHDETAPLEAVVLGHPGDFGGIPKLEDAYDPKSRYHIENGTFPGEESVHAEMDGFSDVLSKYGVEVYRPKNVKGINQVFSRDIGLVIDDRYIIPGILENRAHEIEGVAYIVDQVNPKHVLRVGSNVRLEGGDIMPYHGKIFAGYSKEEDFKKYVVSRTNEAGIDFLMESFKDWEVKAFELNKSDHDPYQNALHLDCCFQPIGKDMAIIYPGGFKNMEDVEYLKDFFGADKLIEITQQEMYDMCSNVFSISPEVIVSEQGFTRVNQLLRDLGFTVEEIKYSEIAKMEGLLRCSTMPLRRSYV